MIHKAEREKHKRDLLNDLFSELGEMLGEFITNLVQYCTLHHTALLLGP